MFNYNRFIIICISQFVSLLGSGLSGFCLSVLVYQKTNLAMTLGLVALCDKLPAIISSFFAGYTVDKFSKKKIIIFMDLISAINTLLIAFLYFKYGLSPWHVYLNVAINAAVKPFHSIALASSTPLLVEKEHLPRANGLIQVITAASDTISPLVAGLILSIFSMKTIFFTDFVTFLLAVTLISRIDFGTSAPKQKKNKTSEEVESSFAQKVAVGWKYTLANKSLTAFLLYISIINFVVGFFHVLLTPMVLTLSDEKGLGMVLSCGSFGMLLGGIIVSRYGVPKNLVKNLIVIGIIESVAVFVIGYSTELIVISIALTCMFFCFPFFGSSSQALWQKKIPPSLLGRVFAVKQACMWTGLSIAYILSGYLQDSVFKPLFDTDMIFFSILRSIWGRGTGRELGAIFGLISIVMFITCILFSLNKSFTQLEKRITDQY